MHIYFSGIGGAAIGPLALIAKQAGYEVSGSDIQPSDYIDYLQTHGIKDIHIGQTSEQIAKVNELKPIDWFVYSSALPKTDPDHAELKFCQRNGIKTSKRDELLNKIITDKNLKLLAIAGTHGKTTTTAMMVWLFKQLNIPISYSVGAKLSFGEPGEFDPQSKHFIYEADEYDRNFLSFHPEVSLITGLDWDHPDIYATRQAYDDAFRQFLKQSQAAVMWQTDVKALGLSAADNLTVLKEDDPKLNQEFTLKGLVNRQNAWQVAQAAQKFLSEPLDKLIKILNEFPGLARRFERIAPNLYSDYAHTPAKIRGALQRAHEVAGDNVVVVYEGLHNLRQHFIKDQLKNLFDGVKQLYIVPSYLAREDPNLELLTPDKILDLLSNSAKGQAAAAKLDGNLKTAIQKHLDAGDLVLCLTAGGPGSLDEWLRKEFA